MFVFLTFFDFIKMYYINKKIVLFCKAYAFIK